MGAAGRSQESAAKVFELAPNDGFRIALGAAALSLVVAVVCALVFGFGFLILVVGAGPAIFYLVSGAPTAIEVHPDRR